MSRLSETIMSKEDDKFFNDILRKLYNFNVFKFNHWALRNQVETILRYELCNSRFTDYKIICNEENNPASVIDSNELIADLIIDDAHIRFYIKETPYVYKRTMLS